jgi:catechol 2,3-dioxygenase-like lactoylglutathione lyase family enzyme
MAALWSEGHWPDLLERPCTGPFDFTFDGGLSWSKPECGWWGNLSLAKVALEHTQSGEHSVPAGTHVLFVNDENGTDWRFLSVPDGQVLAAGRSLVSVMGAFGDGSVCYFEPNSDSTADIVGRMYFVEAGRAPVMVAEPRDSDLWMIGLSCVQDEGHRSVLYTTASKHRAGEFTLWALDLDSGAITRMKQTPPYICIPDLFDNDATGLSKLRIRGDELLPAWRVELGYPAGFLSWSNDGSRIAFERSDSTSVDSIVVLEADSGRIVDTIESPGSRAARIAYFDDNDRIHVVKRAEAVDLVYELAK